MYGNRQAIGTTSSVCKSVLNHADQQCRKMEKSNKISVVINTYNAEEHLAKALDAVKDFDEIVVCDMESTDSTLSIAKKYGCKIVMFPKENHKSAEPARTFAIQSATSKWVLVVDSDEIITPELKDYLYSIIKQKKCPEGLYIARKNKFMGEYSRDWSNDYQLRFFIREGTVWPPYVHTFPTIQGRVEYAPSEYKILHLADESIQHWVSKMNEYTDNESVKKANRNYGICTLFWRPAWSFIRSYIIQGGFRSGKRGFMNAILSANYQVIVISKMIEKRIRAKK